MMIPLSLRRAFRKSVVRKPAASSDESAEQSCSRAASRDVNYRLPRRHVETSAPAQPSLINGIFYEGFLAREPTPSAPSCLARDGSHPDMVVMQAATAHV